MRAQPSCWSGEHRAEPPVVGEQFTAPGNSSVPREVRVGFLEEVTAEGVVSEGRKVPGTEKDSFGESFSWVPHPKGPLVSPLSLVLTGLVPRPGVTVHPSGAGRQTAEPGRSARRQPHHRSQNGLHREGLGWPRTQGAICP